ncbi:MAG: CRISPR-associated endoribonuclease Cas6 [Acidobacteria bacterium]|jgi:CRISPR-associated endoribonuclease Cas6|nr:MAG: CRISPR-associated endoribonuclease Cas6 [Acidobacteriota bacterium]GIU81617.1 MAG: CRISPR-associated endoribonuclease Cas6 [Pyrinomonadaceae bacterium]
MRLVTDYRLKSNTLPIDYRRGFASLIKEALRRENKPLYELYYSRPTPKPFTFSVFFPELSGLIEINGRRYFNVGSKARLNFSTCSKDFYVSVYNGFLNIEKYQLFENELAFENLFIGFEARIAEEKAVFKTMSPVVINKKGESHRYLLPEDSEFAENLGFHIKEISSAFGGIENPCVEFKAIEWRRRAVKHYDSDIYGFTGIFELYGQPKVLNLIYQVGLGVRRSQGFGMLELAHTSGQQSQSSSQEETAHG